MKYFLFTFFLIALSCNQSKKEPKKTIIQDTKIVENKEETTIKKVEEKLLIKKTQENILLVLKNPKNSADVKTLIENSGLVWDNLIIDKKTLKVASVKVPLEKKDFWMNRLKESNIFSSIQISTKKAIDAITKIEENTYAKIRKSQCSGDCAVYELTLFKDGKVLYNGIENVLIKGKKEFLLSEHQFKKIKEKFKKTSFNSYPDSYVDKSLMDYPSTFISYNNKQIEIKLWKNVPDELAFAYETLEDLLYEKKLIE